MSWLRAHKRIAAAGAGAIVVVIAVSVAALGGSDGDGGDDSGGGEVDGDDPRVVQPGAPGEDTEELDDEEAAAVTVPEHVPADTLFMHDMILHHQQALDMAALVEERTDRDDLPVLAERITLSQEAEIELIEEWLTDRDEGVPDEDERSDHSQHEGMPGMATEVQLEGLEAAEGPAFDRLFLDLMIAHHQGAVTMVENLYAAGAGLEPAADQLARSVEADQNIEIRRMQELLATLP